MKNIKFFAVAITLLGLTACKKVLDKTNLSGLEPDLVFQDSVLVQLNMDGIYGSNLPAWGGQNTSSVLSGVQPQLSEEGATGGNKFMEGTMSFGTDEPKDFGTALNTSATNPSTNWGKIRQVNVFIKAMEASPLPDYTKRKFIAQAKFFRAFRYWDMVRINGGVPLVLVPLDGVGEDARNAALLPRDKTSDCFTQMVTDLDYAIANLPARWTASTDWGRITSAAAAAFKGRVLLYWASPMFNPGDVAARWQAAYDANLKAKQLLDANGYGLNSSYQKMWFTEGNSNPEAVMVTCYNTATGDQAKLNNGWDKACRPAYLNGSGSNQPTWELVRSYPMKDGKMPGDPSSAYTYYDTLFYKNRDPRFDATVAYNGCTWPLDGNTTLRLWTYYETSSKSTEANASNTGFYCRKAVSEGTFTFGDPQYSGTDWMEIRYAEVLLNLAESAAGINKVSATDEAYTSLIAVRKRAGITSGTNNLYGLAAGMSRAQLFDAILFERKIEFAFEGKRFWDLYRWKRMSDLNGWYKNRLRIVLKTGAGIPSATALKDPTSASYRDVQNLDNMMANFFQTIRNNTPTIKNSTTSVDTNPINFLSTYYFFPIPAAAITNNPNLQQNNNWGGTFDPLQ
jgi:hypothetical protein